MAFSQPLKFLKSFQEIFAYFYWDFMFTSFIGLPLFCLCFGVPEGNLDLGATLGSYFDYSSHYAFSAVGILASSLSSNQIMAYLLGVFLNFILYFG